METQELLNQRTDKLGDNIKYLSKAEVKTLAEITDEQFVELEDKAKLKAKELEDKAKLKAEYTYPNGIVFEVYTKKKFNSDTGEKNKPITVVIQEEELAQHLSSYKAWGTVVECVKHPDGKKGVDAVNETYKLIKK